MVLGLWHLQHHSVLIAFCVARFFETDSIHLDKDSQEFT